MLLNQLTLHLPKTSLEAAKLFKEEDTKVLAGGTFLLNSMKLLKHKGTKTARNVLSLAKVTDLKGVMLNNGVLTIKAMTTITELKDSKTLLTGNLSVLPIVCTNISTNPIRNMATVGGNLTCRYTWTEMGAVMIALDAQLHFLSPDGKESVMSAEEFFKNAARAENLFTHVTIKHEPEAKVAYQRVKKTMHVDVPFLAVCVKTNLSGKRWTGSRVAVNSGTAFAQRDYALEEFLNKSESTSDLGTKALEHLTKEIYDTRSTDYKQHMFRVSIRKAVEEICHA
jgi:aerobic carbon-monoxide dehydrogenase medium subunit